MEMHPPPFRLRAILAMLLPTINALTLSQIQPINGFSTACQNAYNTPLSGCTATDFSSGVCSSTCISFLDALTQIINAECSGTGAYPNTLMGSFFQYQGTRALCPNDLEGGPNQGQGDGGSYSLTATGATSASTAAKTAIKSLTSTATSTMVAHSSTAQITSILSASAAATTTSDVIERTTVIPNAHSSLSTTKASDTKLSTFSMSSLSTSASSTSSAGGGVKGGGTILDVGSNASCRNVRLQDWLIILLAGSAGMGLLL